MHLKISVRDSDSTHIKTLEAKAGDTLGFYRETSQNRVIARTNTDDQGLDIQDLSVPPLTEGEPPVVFEIATDGITLRNVADAYSPSVTIGEEELALAGGESVSVTDETIVSLGVDTRLIAVPTASSLDAVSARQQQALNAVYEASLAVADSSVPPDDVCNELKTARSILQSVDAIDESVLTQFIERLEDNRTSSEPYTSKERQDDEQRLRALYQNFLANLGDNRDTEAESSPNQSNDDVVRDADQTAQGKHVEIEGSRNIVIDSDNTTINDK